MERYEVVGIAENICIFGAGDIGTQALIFLGNDKVDCFIDNDKEKQGTDFHKKPVISYEDYEKTSDSRIVIATFAWKEITKQLEGKGNTNYWIFLPNYVAIFRAITESETSCTREYFFGVDNITEFISVLSKYLNTLYKKKLEIFEINEKMVGKEYDEIVIQDFRKLNLSKQDKVIVSSEERAFLYWAYLEKEKLECEIVNPYLRIEEKSQKWSVSKRFFGIETAIVSKGVKNDLTEEEWNRHLVENYNVNLMNEYVRQIYRKQKLFDFVGVETINRCNGKCSFCPVSVGNDIRHFELMDEEMYKRIVDQLAEIDYSGIFATYLNNEPFLDHRIEELNRYAREKLPKARIVLYSNGTLLTIERFLNIIDYLDELIIDNYNQELLLNKESRQLVDYCKNRLDLMKKVTIIILQEDQIRTSRGGDAPNRKDKLEFGNLSCAEPFKHIFIRPDGKISLCCSDPYGKMTLGDIKENTLLEIWHGENYASIRRKMLIGRSEIEYCKNCDAFYLY